MNITTEKISQNTTKHRVEINNQLLNFEDWINLMKNSDVSILKFNSFLAETEFEAYFWEVKPVKSTTMNQNFEFVLVDSSSLLRLKPDKSHFNQYFVNDKLTVNFSNLRGDAELVVPTQTSDKTKYQHIASFVRTAEQNQIINFWRQVVTIYLNKIDSQYKWLSTSGLGVHWLHVRIDNRPKYYQHLEYKL